jgi:energy-coupling factor transporter ATP-binding protein EcfA2
MIISLRGTNGSGKSTLVRTIMAAYKVKTAIRYPGKQRPRGYVCLRVFNGEEVPTPSTPLFVPGHYEIDNGGVDTLPDLDTAYELIKTHALELGCDVLYEGKNMSDGAKRLLELRDAGLDVAVACIDIPVGNCVAAVRTRGHKIKVETIEKLHAKCQREMEKFKQEGIECFSGNRVTVLRTVRQWLKIQEQ